MPLVMPLVMPNQDEVGRLVLALHHKGLHFNASLECIRDDDIVFVSRPETQDSRIMCFAQVDYFHGVHGYCPIAQMCDDDESDCFVEDMRSTKESGRLWRAVTKIKTMWRLRRRVQMSGRVEMS